MAQTVPHENVVLRAGPPVYGGYTLGRTTAAPKIILIRGAIPGELVEVSINEEKKDYYLASVENIIEPSEHRIQPKYASAEACGGCQFQYISYGEQVEMKQQVLTDALRRIGNVIVTLDTPIISEDAIWNYRFRGQFKVENGLIGFYKEKSNEIIDTDYSLLMIEPINEALKGVRSAMATQPELFRDIQEIQISYGDGAYASVRANPSAKHEQLFWDSLAELLLECCFEGVFVKTGREMLKYGQQYLTLPLDGLTYTASPVSFFQSNWKLNQQMVDFIKERFQPLSGKRVLDLFSGAGNFTLPLAQDADEVIAVEENPLAVEDGKRNLRLNRVHNMRFYRASAEAYDISKYSPFDIVIVDPPRAGLSSRIVENLLQAHPNTIVYISCNPSTLARDIKRLAGTYKIESIRLVDLFPQTYHIETLAFLTMA
ncbi:MAG: class I SAM-dependent RNA methyltransferase [Candidatus Aquicultor sp.]